MLSKHTNSKLSSGILWYFEVYSLISHDHQNMDTASFPMNFSKLCQSGNCEKVMWQNYRRDRIGCAAGDVQPIRKKEHMTNIDRQFKSQKKQWIYLKHHINNGIQKKRTQLKFLSSRPCSDIQVFYLFYLFLVKTLSLVVVLVVTHRSPIGIIHCTILVLSFHCPQKLLIHNQPANQSRLHHCWLLNWC